MLISFSDQCTFCAKSEMGNSNRRGNHNPTGHPESVRSLLTPSTATGTPIENLGFKDVLVPLQTRSSPVEDKLEAFEQKYKDVLFGHDQEEQWKKKLKVCKRSRGYLNDTKSKCKY